MREMIDTVMLGLKARRRCWRRARNLRAGARAPVRQGRPSFALGLGVLAFVLGGALLIAVHARSLAGAARTAADGAPRTLAAFQPVLPGLDFEVPAAPGAALSAQPGGALLVLSGMRPERPVAIDLCAQRLEGGDGRLVPIRIGARFDDVARWAMRNERAASPVTLRNLVLAGSAMPRMTLTGAARPGLPLQLAWEGEFDAAWAGDAGAGATVRGRQGAAAFGTLGWLVWGGSEALRLARRPSAACPEAGELVLTRYRAGSAGMRGQAFAFSRDGAVRSLALAPGRYRVPAAAPAALEDGTLFDSLLAQGLVRLGTGGTIEVAPRELADWRAAPAGSRAADLRAWDGVRLDDSSRRLLERLHGRADGAYVREQIRVFNGERRLLAWRTRPGATGSWQAEAGALAAPIDEAMPPAAARLFDRLPQGWGGWRRVAAALDPAAAVRLRLDLPHPARGGEQVDLLLAGRLVRIEGAALVESRERCRGRACPDADAVRELRLALAPGARRVVIKAAPLDLGQLAGADAAYRHVVLESGRLAWQDLPRRSATGERIPAAPVVLQDRAGTALWREGGAVPAARAAGLAGLLGLRSDHGASVAGMLARLPAGGAGQHTARLTLDLTLQRAAQSALDCVGLRRGSWDGARCHGGGPVPAGREAGLVLLDTASGDILAAASAGAGDPASNALDWNELFEFDRANPARSPLRQAAFQHDGGAERSPGSTFKIVTALGLELAARRDPSIDALLGGMALPAMDGLARARGFDFRTAASTYPLASDRAQVRAHVTNFRDQGLDRRARDGRLGLAEALTYSLNTWFAWTYEMGDASLFGRPEGGAPSLRALDPEALAGVRPVLDMAHRLGFERPLRLDGGLLPADYAWRDWDALAPSPAAIDPIGSRHELRQMAIGLRMQATPLHMAMAAGAVGEGRAIAPRLLLELDGRAAREPDAASIAPLGVRLDRIRAGLRGVVARGTAAAAFRGAAFDALRPGLHGKTGTAPVGDGSRATVWFAGWLEPGSIPGQSRRLAFAAFVSRSEGTGGEHAAPVVAALLRSMPGATAAVRTAEGSEMAKAN